MEKLPLFSLPCVSTGAIDEPTVIDQFGSLLVSFVCDDNGHERACGVRFAKVRASRWRAEIYCTGWHIEGAYDTVCEIIGSDWVAELRKDAVPEWRDYWVMRHFMIYLDGFSLEVIAESAALEDESVNNSGGT